MQRVGLKARVLSLARGDREMVGSANRPPEVVKVVVVLLARVGLRAAGDARIQLYFVVQKNAFCGSDGFPSVSSQTDSPIHRAPCVLTT